MTKKITISVPDELHKKMEKWKQVFNFSGVFQKAIQEKIRRHEDFKKRTEGDPKMKEIIERLSSEKKEAEENWFNWGKEDGLEWGKSAHYDEIQLAVNGREDPESVVHELSDDSDFLDGYLDYYRERERGINDLPADWERGFIAGICDFWDEVADKL